jgi:hypothetical protein
MSRLDHYHFDTFTAVPLEPRDEVVSYDRSTLSSSRRALNHLNRRLRWPSVSYTSGVARA